MLANTWQIARNTIEDAIRRRVLVVFLVLAILTLGAGVAIQYNSVASRGQIYTPGQMLVILIFGALIAITTSVFLIPTEIERRTIYSVLSKPVQRWEFFVGKFLGGSLATGLMVGVMALVLTAAIMIASALPTVQAGGAHAHQHVDISWATAMGVQLPPIIVGALLVFIQLVVVTAIATFLSLFLTATVNFSVTAFLWILGSLQWIVLALANRQGEGLFIVPWILRVVYWLTPHFYDVNVLGGIVKPEVDIQLAVIPAYAGLVSAYTLIYVAVLLCAGMIIFEKKEV